MKTPHARKCGFPFLFRLNGVWSWWKFHRVFGTKNNPVWLKNGTENCQLDHIPFNFIENGNIFFLLHARREIFSESFWIKPKIRLYIPFSDWSWTKVDFVWFQINRKMVNTIWFWFDFIKLFKVIINNLEKFQSIQIDSAPNGIQFSINLSDK